MSEIEWRDVVGHEGEYQVSRCGRVRSVDRVIRKFHARAGEIRSFRHRGRELSPAALPEAKYLFVQLGAGNVRRVHRLVAEAFIENPNARPQVDHIDGNRVNNHASNLRWVTASTNHLNRHVCGSMHGFIGVSSSNYGVGPNPYCATIGVNGVRFHLGTFPTAELAGRAHKTAREKALENV